MSVMRVLMHLRMLVVHMLHIEPSCRTSVWLCLWVREYLLIQKSKKRHFSAGVFFRFVAECPLKKVGFKLKYETKNTRQRVSAKKAFWLMVAVFQFPHLTRPTKSFHGIHVNKGIPSICVSSETKCANIVIKEIFS